MRLPTVQSFSHRVRGPQLTARLGLWLGVCIGVCMLTGIWSHLQQTTPGWLDLPPSPARLYQVTQGVHVLSGTAAIVVVVVKLWSVFPRLFVRPPRQARELVLHALERLSILVLVGSVLFELTTGTLDLVQAYPWGFGFRSAHYAVAYVAVGAVLVHVAVKLPVIRDALRTPVAAAPGPGISRRGLLRTTWLAAGLAVFLTAGQSVPLLRKASVFAVRDGAGPQGLPINRTAGAAGVEPVGEDWRLEIVGARLRLALSYDELSAMEQVTCVLPIACVEGWSASARWTGVRVRDLVARVGGGADARVLVTSRQTRYAFGSSELPPAFVRDPRTLLALELDGEPLNLDHGHPCRIIAPNRPGVRQTKWVTRLEVFG